MIRKMELTDISDVLEVEKACFLAPWNRAAFVYELTENPFATYFVIEQEGKIIGYAGLWVAFENASITNIGILPVCRGRKQGEKLLKHVLDFAYEKGAETISLEVRASNIPAQKMYEKLGFQVVSTRKGYYTDNNEDAKVMWKKLREMNL